MNLEAPKEAGTEKEKEVMARVVLNIFRHGEKDGPNDVTQAEDELMKLTDTGRMQAHERGQALETTGGTASGSPKRRTQETALHMAHANNPEVHGEESLEELIEKTGHRTWINAKLDMPFDKDHPDFEVINRQYQQNRLLRYYIEIDEACVREGGERGATIYGRQVYNIASLVERFARITRKLGERNARAQDLGEEFVREREQNMGTHGSVAESFLVEVIRRLAGPAEVERLLDTIPNGVEVSEGMRISIESLDDETLTLRLSFSVTRDEMNYAYRQEISLAMLQDIVHDFAPPAA